LEGDPLRSIEAPEIVNMIQAIEERGARDIAKRALETTGQIFRYAIAHGKAKRNPASEIRRSDVLKVAPRVNYARVDAKELSRQSKSTMALQILAWQFG